MGTEAQDQDLEQLGHVCWERELEAVVDKHE